MAARLLDRRPPVCLVVPTQAVVGTFVETHKEFPPRQRPSRFSVDQIMETLEKPLGGKPPVHLRACSSSCQMAATKVCQMCPLVSLLAQWKSHAPALARVSSFESLTRNLHLGKCPQERSWPSAETRRSGDQPSRAFRSLSWGSPVLRGGGVGLNDDRPKGHAGWPFAIAQFNIF